MWGRSGRVFASAIALGAVTLVLGAGCAGPLILTDDGFRHPRHDYWIHRPGGPGPAWQRLKVKGAVLAYRRAGPQSISLQSRCGKPVATPQLMARHLVIRLRERELLAAGPVSVDGRNGWSQTFDTTSEGTTVRVKTVTLVALDCTFDWTLAVSGDFEEGEQAFDAWWNSFRLGEHYAEEGT